MVVEFTASPDFDFITRFAEQVGAPVRDDLLMIPAELGAGYIRKVGFGEGFKLMVHRYVLKEDLIIKRNPDVNPDTLRTIFFYNNEDVLELNYNNEENRPFSQKNDSAIQLSTNDLRSVIRFPAGSDI